MRTSKRDVLKGLAVAVPAVWAKPAVDTVILPAHARMSFVIDCINGPTYRECGEEFPCPDTNNDRDECDNWNNQLFSAHREACTEGRIRPPRPSRPCRRGT